MKPVVKKLEINRNKFFKKHLYKNIVDVTVFIEDYHLLTHRFGKYLFKQGEESDMFYFIKSGTVEVNSIKNMLIFL